MEISKEDRTEEYLKNLRKVLDSRDDYIARLRNEIDELKSEIRAKEDLYNETQSTINQLQKKADDTEEVEIGQEDRTKEYLKRMQRTVDSRDNYIARLRNEIDELKSEIRAKEDSYNEAQSTINRLQKKTNTTEKADSIEVLEELSRQAAYFASGGDELFKDLILPLKLDIKLPIQISAKLETKLRVHMRELDPSVNLFELIKRAQESEIFDDDAVEMAHIIRKQRNSLAHARSTEEESTARILLTLFSAAILWPKLPDSMIKT